MATRLFLRNLTISATGTYPSASRFSATTAYQMTGATTVKKMSVSAGTLQSTISATTVGTTSQQWGLIGMWSSKPLAAQSITAADYTVTVNLAILESNLNANFGLYGGSGGVIPYLYIWRPSSGSHVVDLIDNSINSGHTNSDEPTATNEFQVCESAATLPISPSVSIASGDVLMLELWIGTQQGMGSAYNVAAMINGSVTTTVDQSVVTNHASFIEHSYDFVFSAGAITGSSNQTIGSITGTAAATHPVVGSSTQTTGSITATGRGSVAIVGASTQTIGSITATEAGRVYWLGASTQTVGSITGTAAGTVAITGSSNQTIGSITGTAVGTVLTHGTSTQTIGSITGTAAGSVAVVGASTQTVGSITATGRGSVLVTGVSTLTIGSITGTALGTVTTETIIHGVSDLTVGSITATGRGTVLTHGVSTQAVGSITATGRGSVAVAGASTQTIGSITATGRGSVAIAGASTQTVGSITSQATGLIGDIITGSSNQTIAAFTGNAAGSVTGAAAAQPDPGAGSGAAAAAYTPRRVFRVPKEAYKDWSLEQLYPVEQILSPPPTSVDLTRQVVYTPLADALAMGVRSVRLPPAPQFKPVKVALAPKIEEDDDDELSFILSLLF